VAPPAPRPGLEAGFQPSEIAVRVNLPSPERAAELRALRREPAAARALGEGPPPLVERRPPIVPSRPLSYTAISAYEECPYRFYMERVLGLTPGSSELHQISYPAGGEFDAVRGEETIEAAAPSAREERTARGAAVHALLEWSQAHGWAEPSAELTTRHAEAVGLAQADPEDLLGPVRAWIDSPLRAQIAAEATRMRTEVPLLLGIGGTVLRGSIDLLVERKEAAPLVLDYKTDRLDGADPAERAAHYDVQRSIYALSVAEALGAEEVEVAYVFLERPDEPAISRLGATEMTAARTRLEEAIDRIGRGEFPVAAPEERDWALCRGCPALRGLCSGPRE